MEPSDSPFDQHAHIAVIGLADEIMRRGDGSVDSCVAVAYGGGYGYDRSGADFDSAYGYAYGYGVCGEGHCEPKCGRA